MPLLKDALNILENSELKVTERRVRMIEVMYKEDRYLSAKEVKAELESTYPGISPDTIYRNLHSFSTLDILEETEIDGEKFFRANCGIDEHHHHFICTKCGSSIELPMCPLAYFKEEIGEAKVTSHRFELLGICEKCMKEEAVVS
ncbi:MAG TPA: Fur family transcriptional regulator [Atopostipes sp.]|nr:Fur family transcriptional regulator [Atopostipes sp.]